MSSSYIQCMQMPDNQKIKPIILFSELLRSDLIKILLQYNHRFLFMRVIYLFICVCLIAEIQPWCLQKTIPHIKPIQQVDWAPDNSIFVSASPTQKVVRFYNATTYEVLQTYTHTCDSQPLSIKISKDSKYIGVGYQNGDIKVFNATPPFSHHGLYASGEGRADQIDFDYNSTRVMRCGCQKNYKSYNLSSGAIIQNKNVVSPDKEASACRYAISGHVGYAAIDKRVSVYTGATPSPAQPFKQTFSGYIFQIDFTPTTSFTVVSASIDKYVRFNTTIVYTDNQEIWSVSVGRQGKYFASGGKSQILRIFNATTKLIMENMTGFVKPIYSVKISQDQKTIITGDENGEVRIYKDVCIIVCNIIGCLNCTTQTSCGTCDTANNYFKSGNTCVLCTITNCVTAVFSGSCSCSVCADGYAPNGSGGCNLCTVTLGPYCTKCSSQAHCTQCNTGLQYYLHPTSHTCQTCVLNGCSVCSGLTTCQTCNTGLDFFMNPATGNTCIACALPQCTDCLSLNQCAVCNTNADYFLNGSSLCQQCSLVGCTDCSSLVQCSVCNTTQDYFLVAGPNICQKCTLVGCTDCQSLTQCSICDEANNYFLNGNTCQQCTLVGCTDCQSLTQCSICNQANNYFKSGNICVSCTITNCVTAVFSGSCSCSVCADGYAPNGSGGCNLCTVTLGPYCTKCSSQAHCTQCNTGLQYYLHPTSHTCQTCVLNGCSVCSGLTTCQTCNTGLDFFMNPATGNTCIACALPQCTDCLSLNQCAVCNTNADYFLNGSSLCQQCSLVGCTDCSSLVQCSVCNTTQDYFLVAGPNICQKCTLVGCTDCQSLTQCSICDEANNYFLNGNTCQLCTLGGCQDCDTLTTCAVCNATEDYFMNGSTVCQQCNLTQCDDCISMTQCGACETDDGYFLNILSKLCELCTLNECTLCSTSTLCAVCNTTNDYFLNGANQCELCTLNECTDCDSLTACLTCNNTNNYFLNTTSDLCQPCPQVGCIACTGWTTCSLCSVTDLYVLNTTNDECYYCNASLNLFLNNVGQCQPCTLTGCSECLDLEKCTVCDNSLGFFIDASDDLCDPCSLIQCLMCSSLTDCAICNTSNDFFLNDTSKLCEPCSINECADCSSSTLCAVCNTTNDYFLNGANQCELCTLNECTDCDSLTACLTCNNTNNYFLNTTSDLCQPCPQVGCIACTGWTTCSLCSVTDLYVLNTTNDECYYCNASLNLFLNNVNQCQLCSLSFCLLCYNLTSCLICNQSNGYFLNLTDNQCEFCSLSGCLTCQSLTSCAVCDTANNWGLTHDGTCKQCPFTCLCDGYLLPKYTDPTTGIQYCSTTCGDGLVRNFEECDDGNTLDGDGCSAQCKIQKAWSCNNDPSYTCCTLQSTKIELKVNRIVKVPNQNSMTLQLEVKPTLAILTPENMQKFVTLSITGVTLFNERKSARNGQIMEVTYDYNQSIHGKKGNILFQIQFSQNGAPSCMISASKSITIMAQANNNLPFMFYDQADLEKQEEVADSVNAMEIITGVIFLLSMIPCKIIGLELIGVLQLAYFSLAQQENINILLEPFMKMNELNGMNVDLVAQDKALPDQVSALGIRALFLNNCNVMLFVVLAQVLTAAMLYGLGHVMQSVSQKLSSVSKYLIKEGLLTMMMFNAFNIAFGVGIHFQYADKNDSSYALSSVAAILAAGLIFGSCALLMFTEAKQFGEFKDKLKPNLMCQLYFVFSLAYRFVLGYYIAVKNEYVMSSLVIVGFSILFIGYNLVNLPFVQAYHNYRANICHVSQLVILLVTNYYDSLLQNQPLQQKAYQFSAAEIQIGAIYTAVGFSSICLFVEGYKLVKAKFSKPGNASPSNSIKQKISVSEISQLHYTDQDFIEGINDIAVPNDNKYGLRKD